MLRRVLRHVRHKTSLKPSNVANFRHCHSLTASKIQPCFKHNLNVSSQNFTQKFHVSLPKHLPVFFADVENDHASNFLPKLEDPFPELSSHSDTEQVLSNEQFEQILNQNWRSSNINAIVKAFLSVKSYCISHNVPLSDTRFDKLVDGLMDHCEKLSDLQLYQLLQDFCEYPYTDGINSHNFHDVWSCLDDICCWKMVNWKFEKMLAFAWLWYKLRLGRMCDYIFEVLDKMTGKSKFLDKDTLVHFFFYNNVCRRRSVAFPIEFELEKHVDKMNVHELGVVAMGYFKSKSKVKLSPILEAMMQAVMEKSETINDITVSAILKAVRFSQKFQVLPSMRLMMDKLQPEMDRLSLTSCLHVALIGTGTQYVHTPTLKIASQRIVENIKDIRLKEVERILNANTMFNIDPETVPDFYKTIFDNIHEPYREIEFLKYPRCLPSALHYLSMRQIYSPELSDRVLSEDFISMAYGGSVKLFPKELFSLTCSLEIECPEYKGNWILPVTRYKAAKWQTDFAPSYGQWKTLSVGDKFFLDVQDHVSLAVGGEQNVKVHHVLPHFCRADIIVCRDNSTGQFVEPFIFQNYVLGDIMRPIDPEGRYQFFAIITLSPNTTMRDADLPLGSMLMKQRQLKTIGYEPIFVGYKTFPLLSKTEKIDFFMEIFSVSSTFSNRKIDMVS